MQDWRVLNRKETGALWKRSSSVSGFDCLPFATLSAPQLLSPCSLISFYMDVLNSSLSFPQSPDTYLLFLFLTLTPQPFSSPFQSFLVHSSFPAMLPSPSSDFSVFFLLGLQDTFFSAQELALPQFHTPPHTGDLEYTGWRQPLELILSKKKTD